MVAGGRLLISCRKTAAGSNPALSAKSLTERAYFPPVVQVVTYYWVVVLMVERVAVNHYVGGSSPSFPAINYL